MQNLEELVAGVKDSNAQVRFSALMAIVKLGPEANAVIDRLIDNLSETNDEIQTSLYAALSFIGKPAVKPLINALSDANSVRRINAALALCGMGKLVIPARDLLIQMALRDPDSNVRIKVRMALAYSELKEAAIEAYTQALSDPDMEVREHAVDSLSTIGMLTSSPIIYALSDQTDKPRRLAAKTLKEISLPTDAAVKALIQTLSNPDPKVQKQAVLALGNFGPAATSAAGALVHLLSSHDWTIRAKAAETLGKIGLTDTFITEALIEAFSDPNSEVSTEAIKALGQLWDTTGQSVEPLTQILSNPDNDLLKRTHVAKALGQLGSAAKSAIGPLTQAFSEPKILLRLATAGALGKLNPTFAPAIDFLIEALSNSAPAVRAQAVEALGDIGPAASRAMDAIINVLTDSHEIVRMMAIEALGKVGDARALPALEQIRLENNYCYETSNVRDAIEQIKQRNQ